MVTFHGHIVRKGVIPFDLIIVGVHLYMELDPEEGQ